MKKCNYKFIAAPLSVGSPTRGTDQAGDVVIDKMSSKFNKQVKAYTRLDFINTESPEEHKILNFSSVDRANKHVYLFLSKCMKDGVTPFIVGGDHSIGAGVTAYNLKKYKDGQDLLVVWIDAHSDINTPESSLSHYYHGMPNAISLGLCDKSLSPIQNEEVLPGNHLAIIGARSIDEGEKIIIKDNNVNCISALEVRKNGIENYIHELKEKTHCRYVKISFDVYSLDPSEITATGYNIPNGLTRNEVKLIIKTLLDNFELASFDCVEYNPTLDKDDKDLNTILDIFSVLL
ncbi:MAG: arginase family protein [Clostridia bacterium]|nr:arginase family protein [Clostridia bacterium]